MIAAAGPHVGPPYARPPYVVTQDCTACGACLLTCPEHAIVVGFPLTVRADRCTSCGECVEVCPADAVLELSSAAEVLADHGVVARSHAGDPSNNSMISAGCAAPGPPGPPGPLGGTR